MKRLLAQAKVLGGLGLSGLGLCLGFSCEVAHLPEEHLLGPALPCSQDEDCRSDQRCSETRDFCVDRRNLDRSLLIEITASPTDPAYAGNRYFVRYTASSTSSPGSPEPIVVPPQVNVRGSVAADLTQAACLAEGRTTLPARLTFSPRERLYGLTAPAYEIATSVDPLTDEFVFEGRIPPGAYDVYIRPDPRLLPVDCLAVPQLYRGRNVLDGKGLDFAQPEPTPLTLAFPWTDNSLQGWMLDVVHPTTGELLSNRIRLDGNEVAEGENVLTATLVYSVTEGEDYVPPSSELIRLQPPEGKLAGTVLLVRSGLVTNEDGTTPVGDLVPSETPVDFRAWLWTEASLNTPVLGTVRFDARSLVGGADVPTAFSREATTNRQGEIQLSLLPGEYRVRTFPAAAQPSPSAPGSGRESTLTVYAGSETQAGQVLSVPNSLRVTGRVAVEQLEGQAPLAGVTIWATASQLTRVDCLPSEPDGRGELCQPRLPPVLSEALAIDPYRPRSRSARSDSEGVFVVNGLDCGECSRGRGANYDVSVRPEEHTGLGWHLTTRRNYSEGLTRESPFVLSAPIAQAFEFRYQDSGASPGLPVRGARIRVYVLLDESLEPTDDLSLPACREGLDQGSAPCLASALQVAETRTDEQGRWALLYPPNLQ